MVGTKNDLLSLRLSDVLSKLISEDEIINWFDLLDAAWVHSGDPKDPHAELTSGWCSNGFFDCLRVLKYVNLSEILAYQLYLRIYNQVGYRPGKVQWTIGSPMAAITFAHDVARVAEIPINQFVEKDPADPKGKRMLWKRMAIPEGDNVLQIEELITTSHTTNEVERAIKEGNPYPVTFVPYIGAIVHRPPKMVKKYGDREVIALIEKEIYAVPPEECPLCKKGSKRLRPKTNWKELTGKI